MRKLGGTDASFLYNETLNTPQHVGNIQYLEVPAALKGGFFDALKSVLLDRIHLLPYLTSRLQQMPWDIDHPAWVRYQDFDIDEHLHHLTLQAPGTVEQLETLCAELYEPVLDREKPLWEMWVIDGMENGQVAVLSKTHHACIDGMASVAVGEILGDFEPTPRKMEPPPASFWDADDVSYPSLMRESWLNLAKYRIDQWSSLPSQMAANARMQRRQLRQTAEHPTMAPKAPWNAAIDGKRTLAGTCFSLSALKAIRKATGTKINDVILAITADALNRYLARHEVELNGPMIAGCPVSLRRPGDRTMNNQVTMMSVSLENDVSDPIKRLSSIHAASKAAKAMLAEFASSVSSDFGGPFVPMQMQAMARTTATGDFANQGTGVPMNLVVSNVPGLDRAAVLGWRSRLGSDAAVHRRSRGGAQRHRHQLSGSHGTRIDGRQQARSGPRLTAR